MQTPGPDLGDRFTDRVRKVFQIANEEAIRLNCEFIGTEHVLLALLAEGSGAAFHVLKNLAVDERIREEVVKLHDRKTNTITQGVLPHAPAVRRVIEYSMKEASELRQHYVGTEHVLLALLRENTGVAAQVLMIAGLDITTVRAAVLKLLGHPK